MSIPGLPGVPPLKATLQRNLISTAPVALFDALIGKANQVWGVFDAKGNQVLAPDSFLGIEYRGNWRIPDYPVENGQFSSYNRVTVPFDAIVSMSKGGYQSDRTKFAATIDSMSATTDLFYVTTPDKKFGPVTIQRVNYERRAENGANLLIVHIHFLQVRETASIQYTQTKTGKPISSTVPAAQKLNATTSTGVASATATTNPASQGIVNQGSVTAITSAVTTGTVQ